MKLGNETGSLLNHLMATSGQPTPEVGMGATVLCWTDRHAATVVKVTPKTFTVQLDAAIRTDERGYFTEDQEYRYERNPNGTTHVFRMTKKGWRSDGYGVLLGHRREYHDPSF